MVNSKLKAAWKKHGKLDRDGAKLREDSYKLHIKGDKLHRDAGKLRMKGDKFHRDANKLRMKGDKFRVDARDNWVIAIIKAYGNISMEWKGGECRLENGEVYEP